MAISAFAKFFISLAIWVAISGGILVLSFVPPEEMSGAKGFWLVLSACLLATSAALLICTEQQNKAAMFVFVMLDILLGLTLDLANPVKFPPGANILSTLLRSFLYGPFGGAVVGTMISTIGASYYQFYFGKNSPKSMGVKVR